MDTRFGTIKDNICINLNTFIKAKKVVHAKFSGLILLSQLRCY